MKMLTFSSMKMCEFLFTPNLICFVTYDSLQNLRTTAERERERKRENKPVNSGHLVSWQRTQAAWTNFFCKNIQQPETCKDRLTFLCLIKSWLYALYYSKGEKAGKFLYLIYDKWLRLFLCRRTEKSVIPTNQRQISNKLKIILYYHTIMSQSFRSPLVIIFLWFQLKLDFKIYKLPKTMI